MSRSFVLPNILELAHGFVRSAIEHAPGDVPKWAIDATVGNGHDTLWLAESVGEQGQVIGCDIQQRALSVARDRVEQAGVGSRVTLLELNHADLHEHIPAEWRGQVSAGMANLGYLPGSDKSIITNPESSVAMLERLLPFLRRGGVFTVAVYAGHPGGQEDAEAVTAYLHSLSPMTWRVFQAGFPNQHNSPPVLIAIERLAGPSPDER